MTLALPDIFQIILVEGGWILLNQQQEGSGSYGQAKGWQVRQWLWNVYKTSLMFYFGVVVTHFSTNIPKYTIGRCATALRCINSVWV